MGNYEERTYDDIEVGEKAVFTKTITQADDTLFAGISGDFNPVHIDQEYAKNTMFKTRIVHGVSIMSAIIGLSGLHNYKFGKTVTIPFIENFSETPYNVIAQNKNSGLHTLCLLDINTN